MMIYENLCPNGVNIKTLSVYTDKKLMQKLSLVSGLKKFFTRISRCPM